MINSVLGTGYLLEEATATRMLRILGEVMVSKDFFVRPLPIGFLAYVSKMNVLRKKVIPMMESRQDFFLYVN